jgi:hypothetical protein
MERRPDRLLDGRDVAGGIDDHAPLRFAPGNVMKALAHPLMEFPIHPLEAGLGPRALGGTGKPNLYRQI